MKWQIIGRHGLIFLGWIACCVSSYSQVLHYNFNETGTTAVNSGSGGTTYSLSILNSSGVDTDLHTSNFYGSSGSSLNLTSASGMGSNATAGNPSAYSGTAGSVLSGSTAFTICGWYDSTVSTNYGNARLFEISGSSGALRLMLSTSGSTSYWAFQYGTDTVQSNSGGTGSAIASTTGNYFNASTATFLAVTYSYDLGTGKVTVTFNAGDSNQSSSLASYSVTYTPTVSTFANLSSLVIGGNGTGASNTRPFSGDIDDFSIYTSVLDSTSINAIRVNEILGIPEPQEYMMLGIGGMVLLFSAQLRKKLLNTLTNCL